MTAAALQDLVAKLALNSDPSAYKQLFLHFHSRLLQFSFAITHNRESSEEVVSDVFLKIWTGRQTLLQVHNFSLYLYVSTKNLSLNCLARQKRNELLYLDEAKVDLPSFSPNPEQALISNETVRRLQAAVADLPPRCRLIFKLVKEDGLSYKEVSELLHLSTKTVGNQMTIALRKLAEALAVQTRFILS